MSNDNSFERLWKLQAKVNMMILDGKRDPDAVASALQEVLDDRVSNDGPQWVNDDSTPYITVTSDGTTGEEWITRLEDGDYRVTEHAKRLLRSASFRPTTGVTTEIAILRVRGRSYKSIAVRYIRAEAKRRKLLEPHPEVACLMREKVRDGYIHEMGLHGVSVMHAPIYANNGEPPLLLTLNACFTKSLTAYHGRPNDGLYGGFAFAVDSYQGDSAQNS